MDIGEQQRVIIVEPEPVDPVDPPPVEYEPVAAPAQPREEPVPASP